MTCGDVKDRLVDYLYLELPEAERKAFEAHLGGCPGCRQEVEALGTTLARTRAAVRTTLDEPPPRVRSTVLAAAAQAAHAAASVRAAGVAVPSGDGVMARFGAWLRRPWVLPAFAAASVMAVFIVAGRTFITAERLDQPAEPLGRLTSPEQAAPAASASAEQPAARRDEAEAPARGGAASTAPPPHKAGLNGLHRRLAKTSERWAAPPAEQAKEADLADERTARPAEPHRVQVARTAAEGARAGAAPARVAFDDPLEALSLGSADGRARADAPAAKKKGSPGTAAPPSSPAPLVAMPGSLPRESAREQAAAPSSRARTAGARAPQTESAAAPSARPDKARPELPYEDLLRRADRAFADRHWADAAADYRELLRRFPGHRSGAAWKARLAGCEQELAELAR